MKNWLLNKILRLLARCTFSRGAIGVAQAFIWCYAKILPKYLAICYCTVSAKYLSETFLHVNEDNFSRLLILNKMMSGYIRAALSMHTWQQVIFFLERNCILIKDTQSRLGKLLLCTHTGDYWISIITAARQYEGSGCIFILPVYEEITAELQAMYDRINIPGVTFTVINIHREGILKISRYLKDPNCVVALFYDLFCYTSGISNGATRSVQFLKRKGEMTVGIVELAKRMKLPVNLVSCCYLLNEKKYQVTITPTVRISEMGDALQEMLSFLESFLRNRPWQWHFIASLDAYYHFPFLELQAKHRQKASCFAKLNYKYLRR